MTEIIVGNKYENYQAMNIKYEILSIEGDRVNFKTLRSGVVSSKTLHWCQKYMKPIPKIKEE